MSKNGHNGDNGKFAKRFREMEAREHVQLERDPKFRAALAKKRGASGDRKSMGKR